MDSLTDLWIAWLGHLCLHSLEACGLLKRQRKRKKTLLFLCLNTKYSGMHHVNFKSLSGQQKVPSWALFWYTCKQSRRKLLFYQNQQAPCVKKQRLIYSLFLFVLFRVFLCYFCHSVSPCYFRLGQLNWPAISSASFSQHDRLLKNTFFHLTFRHIPVVYRLPGIQFVLQKCLVQFWTWSAGEMWLSASWKKTSDCFEIAVRIILVNLNCWEERGFKGSR